MPKRYRVRWTPVAIWDLDQIIEYLAAREGVDCAIDVHDRIVAEVRTLSTLPERCRIPLELLDTGITTYRELVVEPYGVFFRVSGTKVGIIGILDRRRDLEEILLERALHYTDTEQ